VKLFRNNRCNSSWGAEHSKSLHALVWPLLGDDGFAAPGLAGLGEAPAGFAPGFTGGFAPGFAAGLAGDLPPGFAGGFDPGLTAPGLTPGLAGPAKTTMHSSGSVAATWR